MGFKVLLTLDLERDVSTENRQKVYNYLKKQKWEKLKELTTSWKCSFEENANREAVISECKKDVRNAIRVGGVTSYHAALQIGEGEVEEF